MINFLQDNTELTNVLPRLQSELGILILKKEVRRNVVENALLYLKANNKYYEDIEINDNRIIIDASRG